MQRKEMGMKVKQNRQSPAEEANGQYYLREKIERLGKTERTNTLR